MNALDVQIGGKHYKELTYQPVQFTSDVGLNFIQGNIVKYVSRYKFKNGKQDLEKIIHYAQLGKKLQPGNAVWLFCNEPHRKIEEYGIVNSLDKLVIQIVASAVFQEWDAIISDTEKLIKREYETIP